MQMPVHPLKLAILSAIALPLSAFAASPNVHSAVAQRAQGLIDSPANANALQRADQDGFAAKDTIVDADGTEHVRFGRTFRGLPVIGGDVVVHSRNGKFKEASQALKTRGRPDVTPRIDADQAKVEAGADFDGTISGISSKGLVIYAGGEKPVLAYEINVRGVSKSQGESDIRYFIDAQNGRVLDAWNQIQTAAVTGVGQTLLLGDINITTDSTSGGYQLVDPTRGGGSTYDAHDSDTLTGATLFTDADNNWGNNTTSDRASEAADAHFGVATTWDYYKNVHGRNGIFNDGVGVKSYTHVAFAAYSGVNASWNGSYMKYGVGNAAQGIAPVVAIDVAGHEMTHGVTGATAGLAYNTRDSGGLNEGTSDIMGALVEYYANNSADAGDYLVGEKIYLNNPNGTKALRYMFKPSLDSRSVDCYPARGFKNTNNHYSSGVANHFFYLLAEGAVVPAGFGAGTSYNLTASSLVCNTDTTITGIGREKAGKIWYRALTVYMTSTTDYPGARTATLNAARDLYGTGSAEYNAVGRAWSAVSVN